MTGLLIEGLVIVLLVATIWYCAVLSGRLKRLKTEESELRSTIAELITATELAERAIQGLKVTAHEHQKTLGMRVRDAERLNLELKERLSDGDALMEKLVSITNAGTLPPKRREKRPPAQRAAPQPQAQKKTRSKPRAVSELAAEATARINALRSAN